MTNIIQLKRKKEYFVSVLPNIIQKDQTKEFEKALELPQENLEGRVVKGTVVAIDNGVVTVDVNLKSEGRIPAFEFDLATDEPKPKVGDQFDVYVESAEGRNGSVILSREKALREEAWKVIESANQNGSLVLGVIFNIVKGGFLVDLSGVVGFLPGSQVDIKPVTNLSSIMNIVQPFKILSIDSKLKNVVISRRAVIEENSQERKQEYLSKVQVGAIVTGRVKNITSYGAFIEIYDRSFGASEENVDQDNKDESTSIDGLLHVTDISWSKINHPSEILSLGQEVQVLVTKFSDNKISLGMKQLGDNPWDGIENRCSVGQVMVSKIERIADYGIFVKVIDNIEGLIHKSAMNWMNISPDVKKFNIGQEILFKVLEIDKEKYQISLGMKQCQPSPWEVFAKEHPIGSVIKVKLHEIASDYSYMLIKLNVKTDEVKYEINGKQYSIDGVEYKLDGIILQSDISWQGGGAELIKNNYTKDDEVECKVLAIHAGSKDRNPHISFGIKQLTKDLYKDFFSNIKDGDEVEVVIDAIRKDGVSVKFDCNFVEFIRKTELSSDKFKQSPDNFTVGSKIKAKIIGIDKYNRKIALSIKALEVEQHEKLLKEYTSPNASNLSAASLGDALGVALYQTESQKEEPKNKKNDDDHQNGD